MAPSAKPPNDRKPFLLRVDKDLLNALQRWADDELRSLNGQIDFLLRQALKQAGRSSRDLAQDQEGASAAPPQTN